MNPHVPDTPHSDASRPTVIFDMYGVLMDTQSPAHITLLEELTGAGCRLWQPYWRHREALDAGDVELASYWEIVLRDCGIDATSRPVEKIIAADLDSWSTVNPVTVARLRALVADGWRCALLSNIPHFLARHVEKTQSWLDVLRASAGVMFSCDLGAAKPQPRIYQLAEEYLQCSPGEIVFFDDNEKNVAAARRAGWHAVVFRDVADIDGALSAFT